MESPQRQFWKFDVRLPVRGQCASRGRFFDVAFFDPEERDVVAGDFSHRFTGVRWVEIPEGRQTTNVAPLAVALRVAFVDFRFRTKHTFERNTHLNETRT